LDDGAVLASHAHQDRDVAVPAGHGFDGVDHRGDLGVDGVVEGDIDASARLGRRRERPHCL
jgi:hypothetical protein